MDEIRKAIQARNLQVRDNLDTMSKGEALPIGTIRQRPNGNFIKTPGGWKYHSKKSSSVKVGTQAKAASNDGAGQKVLDMLSDGSGRDAEQIARVTKLSQSDTNKVISELSKQGKITIHHNGIHIYYMKAAEKKPQAKAASSKKVKGFSVGDTVEIKSDNNLISLSKHKGKSLKVEGFVNTGLISEPTFLKVKDAEGKIVSINPDHVQKKSSGGDSSKPTAKVKHFSGRGSSFFQHIPSELQKNVPKYLEKISTNPADKAIVDRALSQAKKGDKYTDSVVVSFGARSFDIYAQHGVWRIGAGGNLSSGKVVRDVLPDLYEEFRNVNSSSSAAGKHISDMSKTDKQKAAEKLGINTKGKTDAQLNKLMISANIDKQISNFKAKKKKLTFREVLADTEGRRLVDSIEEYMGDLRDDPTRKEHLEGLKDSAEELEKLTGFKYDISEQLKAGKPKASNRTLPSGGGNAGVAKMLGKLNKRGKY